jgi:hypothetical protein
MNEYKRLSVARLVPSTEIAMVDGIKQSDVLEKGKRVVYFSSNCALKRFSMSG